MTTLRRLKLLLGLVVGAFTVAAIYISVLVVERQSALRETSRYNVAWLASQATTELVRFGQRVSALNQPGSSVDRDEVQLRYAILVNRLKLFEQGDFRDFIRSDPELQEARQAFDEALTALKPLTSRLDEPGIVARILDILTPLDGKLARLAAAANRYSGDRAAQDLNELVWLHRLFSGTAAGLILCGLMLAGMLIWHNRLLGRAHADLHALAENLRRASVELEAANAAVTATNGELTLQNERFDAALTNMSQGLCMVDGEQRLIVCNDRFRSLFGLPAQLVASGTPIQASFDAVTLEETRREPSGWLCAEQDRLIREGAAGSYLLHIADGRTVSVSHQPMSGGGWVATYEDITERRQTEARIAHMAHYDGLTDLPNRTLFRQRLEETLARMRRTPTSFAVLYLDLDRFKWVNDTLGHPTGDSLLQAVGERLRSSIRETDTVARFGGDEFAILQVGSDQPRDAHGLARRILELVSAPYHLNGQEIVIGASIGVAVAPADGLCPDQLLKGADLALYRAKNDGRGTFRFFEPEMDAQVQTRRAMETDLRQAMVRNELELHYQPLVDLRTNAVAGYEALMRWRHPERGMVPPGVFIPVAEEIGLISGMGEWAIRQACAEAKTWPDGRKVSVNLSPVQFRSRNLVPIIVSALADSGLPPSRLELEITESVLLQDSEATLATLHHIRTLGVRIAMDDFGTGYSSLSYICSFPFDKIKIDQSFVRGLSERQDCVAIIESIAALGAKLGMATTAEGVETEEQLEQVRAAGCTEVQGYYLGRPMPARDIPGRAQVQRGRRAVAAVGAAK